MQLPYANVINGLAGGDDSLPNIWNHDGTFGNEISIVGIVFIRTTGYA